MWEYVCPYQDRKTGESGAYRAYRAPYEWIPQLEHPKEKTVPRTSNRRFRVPGSPPPGVPKVTGLKK